ncbi:remorin [Panicum miliaceum]|uniref:Remorin n=1 Tax=Panicum miliaceum TaxID=4540 RepID=A0A3L6TAI4_PANMI|nr:remorin [Panicum miliaceum]
MSREFTAMVAAGATMQTGPNANGSAGGGGGYDNGADQLTSIGEDKLEETNPLAIMPDNYPIATQARSRASGLEVVLAGPPPPLAHVEASQVKKEEVETKVTPWQTAEVAKINNRFKREEVVINGWETEQMEKASALFKKIEVSFGSELSNRAPMFDMNLSDFMDDGKPISYDKAKEYFSLDPSQKWAAYVAGTIVLLITELGVRFTDSMSKMALSHVLFLPVGLNIAPRDLALKVENRVVGAPCGVMDHMASACGEANKLLDSMGSVILNTMK